MYDTPSSNWQGTQGRVWQTGKPTRQVTAPCFLHSSLRSLKLCLTTAPDYDDWSLNHPSFRQICKYPCKWARLLNKWWILGLLGSEDLTKARKGLPTGTCWGTKAQWNWCQPLAGSPFWLLLVQKAFSDLLRLPPDALAALATPSPLHVTGRVLFPVSSLSDYQARGSHSFMCLQGQVQTWFKAEFCQGLLWCGNGALSCKARTPHMSLPAKRLGVLDQFHFLGYLLRREPQFYSSILGKMVETTVKIKIISTILMK